MTVYDVTVPLTAEMPTYPGEPGPKLELIKDMRRGDPANVTMLTMGVHSGTHVDAPCHFIAGAAAADSLPINALVGPATVVQIDAAEAITPAHLEAAGVPSQAQRLLFKTRNSRLWQDGRWHSDFVYLTPQGAQWLIDRDIRLVGTDYLSIESPRASKPEVHQKLLAAGVVIIEGLDLQSVPAGDYLLVCGALKLVGGDGAPARVFLLDGRA